MFEVDINDKIMGIPAVKFVFIEPFTSEDMKKVLTLISKFLEKKKMFCFYADTRKTNRPPTGAAIMLIQWMKENKPLFKKYLVCSAVVLNGSTSGIIVKNLLTGAFKIQPPVAPNKIFTNYEKAEKWINEKVTEHKQTQEMQQETQIQ